jgi:hypothetical protein
MATWKKIIVSGSNAHLAQITSSILTNGNLVMAGIGGALQNSGLTFSGGSFNIGSNSIISTGTGSILTGSFSGSFTGILSTNLPDLTQGAGIVPFIYDGSSVATVAVSGASALNNNAVTKWNGNAFVNSSLTDTGTVVSGVSSIQLSGANSVLSGSFSGSFRGDGSALTGIASTLNVSGSTGNGSVALQTQTLSILGTSNEVETSVSGQTVTIGLPNSVTITQDLTVNRNLTVLGTASFQHTEDLDVADRFIRLASGSNAAGDGGIAIQQTNATNAEAFGFDSGNTRWGVSSSFDASQNAFTPDAFMALSLIGTGTDPTVVAARYQVKGNVFIGSDEGIWIYS